MIPVSCFRVAECGMDCGRSTRELKTYRSGQIHWQDEGVCKNELSWLLGTGRGISWKKSESQTALAAEDRDVINLLKPTGYVMHHQSNIQQLYVLPTLYLCVLYLSENKQRLVPLTA